MVGMRPKRTVAMATPVAMATTVGMSAVKLVMMPNPNMTTMDPTLTMAVLKIVPRSR